jgi:hypothetical protein
LVPLVIVFRIGGEIAAREVERGDDRLVNPEG